MATPDWQPGLDWQCRECTTMWSSQWARDLCELEDLDADRADRRRS